MNELILNIAESSYTPLALIFGGMGMMEVAYYPDRRNAVWQEPPRGCSQVRKNLS